MTVLFVFLLLVILPATLAFISERSSGRIMTPGFGIGTAIVYQSEEMSTRPAVGACNIRPSRRGEFYYYSLLSYLRVTEVLDDGRIMAVTRDRTRYCFWPNEPQLRKAGWKERLIYRRLFP